MKKIYSKVEEGLLLHIVHKKEEITDPRKDLIAPEEFLQVSTIKMHKDKTFRPHRHVITEKVTTTTQESWVVVQGRVKAILYDIDDQIVAEEVLEPGDISLTLRGGHNYLAMEDDTLVYEYKTGPYLGQEKDKRFIDAEG
jgi:cupin fold WbuC family metalloprotein